MRKKKIKESTPELIAEILGQYPKLRSSALSSDIFALKSRISEHNRLLPAVNSRLFSANY